MIRHSGSQSGIASSGGKFIATAGYDDRVILWDTQSNRAIGAGVHDHLCNQVTFSHCGNFLASSYDRKVHQIQITDKKLREVNHACERV